MASTCRRCGKPIRWEKNEQGRFIPYNIRGSKIHWETCKGEPEENTPLQLKQRIEELESEVSSLRYQKANAEQQLRENRRKFQASQEYAQFLQHEVQNILDRGKAWYRSFEKNGRTEYHLHRLKVAFRKYIEAEKKKKWKSLNKNNTSSL